MRLPFPSTIFTRIECDAVLEHVESPAAVIGELSRVLEPGGTLHLVTPFCHPFHEYPKDYRRFTLDGLKQLAGPEFTVLAEGWRTVSWDGFCFPFATWIYSSWIRTGRAELGATATFGCGSQSRTCTNSAMTRKRSSSGARFQDSNSGFKASRRIRSWAHVPSGS